MTECSVDELLGFPERQPRASLIQQIKDGKYKPNPVRRVEIPKGNKRRRSDNWGVPTVVDRVYSTGNRTGINADLRGAVLGGQFWISDQDRGAHDALRQCQTECQTRAMYMW